jgi:hypothetical protein
MRHTKGSAGLKLSSADFRPAIATNNPQGWPLSNDPALLWKAFDELHRRQRLPGELEKMEFEVVASTPEQFTAWIAAEIPRWGKVIRTNNIRLD